MELRLPLWEEHMTAMTTMYNKYYQPSHICSTPLYIPQAYPHTEIHNSNHIPPYTAKCPSTDTKPSHIQPHEYASVPWQYIQTLTTGISYWRSNRYTWLETSRYRCEWMTALGSAGSVTPDLTPPSSQYWPALYSSQVTRWLIWLQGVIKNKGCSNSIKLYLNDFFTLSSGSIGASNPILNNICSLDYLQDEMSPYPAW